MKYTQQNWDLFKRSTFLNQKSLQDESNVLIYRFLTNEKFRAGILNTPDTAVQIALRSDLPEQQKLGVKTMGMVFDDKTFTEFKKLCKKTNISISEAVRRLIENYLHTNGVDMNQPMVNTKLNTFLDGADKFKMPVSTGRKQILVKYLDSALYLRFRAACTATGLKKDELLTFALLKLKKADNKIYKRIDEADSGVYSYKSNLKSPNKDNANFTQSIFKIPNAAFNEARKYAQDRDISISETLRRVISVVAGME